MGLDLDHLDHLDLDIDEDHLDLDHLDHLDHLDLDIDEDHLDLDHLDHIDEDHLDLDHLDHLDEDHLDIDHLFLECVHHHHHHHLGDDNTHSFKKPCKMKMPFQIKRSKHHKTHYFNSIEILG